MATIGIPTEYWTTKNALPEKTQTQKSASIEWVIELTMTDITNNQSAFFIGVSLFLWISELVTPKFI